MTIGELLSEALLSDGHETMAKASLPSGESVEFGIQVFAITDIHGDRHVLRSTVRLSLDDLDEETN